MTYNPFSIEGKTILITGASSGIGRACSIECSKLGAKVIINGRDRDRLEETYVSLEGSGHEKIIADLTKDDELYSLIRQLPVIDGLVCNAGIEDPKPIAFLTDEDILKTFNINVFAPIKLVKFLAKNKILQNGSSVVFTASVAGLACASVGGSLYASSKSALIGFAKGAALDLAKKNIRFNCVCPGMVDTNLLCSMLSDEDLKEQLQMYPLKRFGKVNDIAYAMIYLLSDASSWVTGSNLVVDGGFTLK
jgi:NAD(P)-dependent dehydrogenase (short-subunit alcohol dehydrogenase family)